MKMHFSTRAAGVVLYLLGLAGFSSALAITHTSTLTPPEPINGTDTVLPIVNTSGSTLPEAINGTGTVWPITNTSAIALPEPINGTDALFENETHPVANDTQLVSWMTARPPTPRYHSRMKRSLPPRDRKLADHMENYGENLPECYKKCMRSEDGKSQIHMGQDTLGQICGVKWPLFMWWTEHHLVYCVNGKNGCKGDKPHHDAFKWLKSTCGDKPN